MISSQNSTFVRYVHLLNAVSSLVLQGYEDVLKRFATFKCPRSNFLQPIINSNSRQPQAISECPLLNCLDGVGYDDVF